MRRVIVESPWRSGDRAANIRYLRACLLDCYLRGEAPIASHALGTQCLPETDEGRVMGIGAGFAWLAKADLVALYCDIGMSGGMTVAALKAKERSRWHTPVNVVSRILGDRRAELEQRADDAARAQGWIPCGHLAHTDPRASKAGACPQCGQPAVTL